MKRNLEAAAGQRYQLIVVGGGVTGACVARDAAMRGLSVLLLEKDDFAGATSAASSKLIHGGLRYLQNFEIGLVRTSLKERRIWSQNAPHLVQPLTFLLPTRQGGFKSRMVQSVGLRLYDWLAYDRSREERPEKALPDHKKLSREEVLTLEPGLASDDLTGAMMFYDYQMVSPERLALECILDAVEHGAHVANYAEATRFLHDDNRITGVEVRDRRPPAPAEGHATYRIEGGLVINAAGPWADLIMGKLREGEPAAGPGRHLIRSKGIHLVTRSLTNGHAIAIVDEHAHFFILPWRGHSLLGTTDTVYQGDPDKVHVSERDIVDFLSVVNRGYPAAKLRRSDVQFFYAGLRPIVEKNPAEETAESDQQDAYTASRAAEVYDHEEEEGLPGVITAIGGKWTTSRNLAESVVVLAVKKLDAGRRPCTTESTPTYGGRMEDFAAFSEAAVADHPALPAHAIRHLARNYGSRLDDIATFAENDPALAQPVAKQLPDIAAEIVHAVRHEMAYTLDDVLFRRTGLGTLGSPGRDAVARVADIMGKELGWDAAVRTREIDRVMGKFSTWSRTRAIVNPWAWGNRTRTIWPEIEAKLARAIGPVDAVFTDTPMAATRLTREALQEGFEQILAVGGDGTINEVVNGFFDNGTLINRESILAVLATGTGRDFRRSFGIPDSLDEQIDRLATSEIHSTDLGRLTYTDDEGRQQMRYFDNIASFGLSGAVDRAVNELTWGKKFSGRAAFQWGLLKALATYRNQAVRLRVDDSFEQEGKLTVAAVCNGRYFGSGMYIAPNAQPDDGLFDIVVLGDVSKWYLLRRVPLIYRGGHLDDPHVTVVRGRKVVAEPADGATNIMLDVDGETPGHLPATFEIVPNALYLRY